MPGHGRSFNSPANVKLIRITQNGIGRSRRFSMALANKSADNRNYGQQRFQSAFARVRGQSRALRANSMAAE